METLTCKRCNHQWLPRVKEVKECPKCKSRIWNRPKTLAEILGESMKIISNENESPQQN